MSFVHLHLHTQYSLLDGANKIENLMPRIAELGMPAVAMTDHGNMFGAVEFHDQAKAAGVKPILGCEVYVAPGSRFDRKGRDDDFEAGGNYHLTLLAMNQEGYKNLCRLASKAYLEGFYYKPRIDKELLRELNGGIIALSGCLSGEVNKALERGDVEAARRVMEDYARMFDGRYYVEIQDNKIDAQTRANRHLIQLSREMGLPLVATNDCHYLGRDDAKAHEVLLCIQSKKTWSDPKRWKLDTHELWVKGPEDVRAAFADLPEAVDNTLDIARRCNVDFERNYQFPVYRAPKGESLEDVLHRQASEGLDRRFEAARRTPAWSEDRVPAYRERLEHELGVIRDMGFSGYFLIVADFITEAKRRGIPVGPGRGSAAGSLVAWALGITDIDPIPYDLLFERFLNPERRSMPDIDVDFCMDRRDEVIEYVRERYGDDRVAQIITFGSLKGKAAIKDVGRALEFSFQETDELAKLYPAPRQGKDVPLAEALEIEPRLRERREREREAELFEHALKLEGLYRHASKHAAGVVISDRPLVENLALCRLPGDDAVLTQFDGRHVESIGLIKFDFLGLKTLTFIHTIIRMVREGRGDEIDLSTLPLADPAVYQMLGRGDAVGVFQMESGGMRKLLTDLKPSCFEDLIAVLALYRPGPLDSGMVEQFVQRKHGRQETSYLHEKLEPILRETYGVIVYQEQVMKVAQVLAGYSLGDADLLRRAMGKKKASEMTAQRDRFVSGAVERGLDERLATRIFDQMETFAAYGFNKSHSAAYALISYQTAWLKAHYPREFLAALLTLELSDADKTHKNIVECRSRGIDVLPPDVNESRADFTVVDAGIRFGLSALKGVGRKAAETILAARGDGPFSSLADFCRRVRAQTAESSGSEHATLNKKVLESLIKCGAFDSIEPNRGRLFKGIKAALDWTDAVEKDARSNQIGLFGGGAGSLASNPPVLDDVDDWPARERLAMEKEAIGFYLTAHPLDRYRGELKRLADATTATLAERAKQLGGSPNGERHRQPKVSVGGVIHAVRLKNSKKGDRYATFRLEDHDGVVEVIAWPNVYREHEAHILGEEPVLVKGSVEVREEGCQIIASEIDSLAGARERSARQVHVRMNADDLGDERLHQLREIFGRHAGACPVLVHVVVPDGAEAVLELPDDLRVRPETSLVDAVEGLLGQGVVRIV